MILRLCETHAVRLLPQFILGRLNVLADSLSRGSQVIGSEWTLSGSLPQTVSPLAGRHRSIRDFRQPSAPRIFLPDGRSLVDGDRCNASALGQPSGLCLSSIWPHSPSTRQSLPLPQSGGGARGSLLAFQGLVPGSSGVASGGSIPPSFTEGSTQTTPLPSVLSEPPRSSTNWLPYHERSARSLGFSSRVTHQLTYSRRSSTLLNYQAKWIAYRSWCHCTGHSASLPSIPKIADFFLYLRRSLHLSYSSIALYRSMLSSVFRFVLPSISSRPVLHDLLCSFRIERPLPSFRVPSWDLLRVLSFLRGPPFEPLSSCSLWGGLPQSSFSCCSCYSSPCG